MNHRGTLKLETDRLILRRLTLEDAEALFHNWASDPEVTKYLTWPTHESIKISRNWCDYNVISYKNNEYYNWTIVPKEFSEPIGSIAVVSFDNKVKKAEIGYCIGKAWWHQGYTSEALAGVIRFLFSEVGFNRIEAHFDPRNPNSGKVMKKAGLKYEGIHRQSEWNNQGICDSAVYALLANEYEERP